MATFSITAANVLHSTSATIFTGTAGTTITQGQPLYLDSTTNTYKLANALTNSPVAGIAMVGASNQQDMVICSRDPNFAPGYTIAAGNVVIAGTGPGNVNPYEDRTTGWYVTSLGVGIGGNRLNFYITGSNVAA
jgi:hypothetical protein